MRSLLSLLLVMALVPSLLLAATTGKIAGKVTDAQTGESLPGVNVVLEGTTMGAATNLDGNYVILNVPPGVYALKASMIGYSPYTVQNVRVDIELTTRIDMRIQTEVISGQEVTVVATRPVVVQDISSSQVNIEASQVEVLPIQRVSEVVGVQAGIVGLEVRGGGADQLAFMLDGVTMRDERTNQPITNLALSSVQAVKVETGGFNAEYGNVRSGVVNVVTKEGERDRYTGSFRYEHSPAAQKHFGISPYDPMSFWNRPYLDDAVCWTGTNNGAWDEHMQDQYPAFDGWNEVSRRTLTDDDPTNDLTPWGAQRVYRWQHRKQGDIKDPDWIFDGSFGGPLPFLSDKLGDLRFYVSHKREREYFLFPLVREYYSDNTTQLKLTSNINRDIKLMLTANYGEVASLNDNNNGLSGYLRSTDGLASLVYGNTYQDAIVYGTDYWCPTDIYNHMFAAKMTHTLTPKTFYEVSLERTGVLYRTEPARLRDTSPAITIGNDYWLDEAPYGFQPLPSSGINGIRMGVGMSNSRDYSKIYSTVFRTDLTSQVNDNNQIKSGIELVYNDHQVEYGSIDITLPSGRPWSIWDKNPIRGAIYAQDKIEFKGMIANLGLRVDYSDANDQWYDLATYDRAFFSSQWNQELEETVERKDTESKVYISPRLGISHPITVNSKIYFNYGHFRSMPVAERLYTVRRFTDNSVSQLGDPNLDLSKTVAYELGYEHNIYNQFLLRLAAYYRDVSDQPNLVYFQSSDNKVSYYRASSNYYEDIRGFEVSLERRVGEWITGLVNYTYMVSTYGYFGRREVYENGADQRAYDRLNEYQIKPIPRPYFKANIALRTPMNFGPKVYQFSPLADWITSFQFYWRQGSYYTWTGGGTVAGVNNNTKYPNYYNMDMRISKRVNVKRMNFELYMTINNVLNTKVLSTYAFSYGGNDRRDYLNSLHWDREVGRHLGGYSVYGLDYGDDKYGDLRPDGVAYDPFERLLDNPDNDAAIAAQNTEIAARNKQRVETKSYINNPNLNWLYYLNPRDIFFGIKIDF